MWLFRVCAHTHSLQCSAKATGFECSFKVTAPKVKLAGFLVPDTKYALSAAAVYALYSPYVAALYSKYGDTLQLYDSQIQVKSTFAAVAYVIPYRFAMAVQNSLDVSLVVHALATRLGVGSTDVFGLTFLQNPTVPTSGYMLFNVLTNKAASTINSLMLAAPVFSVVLHGTKTPIVAGSEVFAVANLDAIEVLVENEPLYAALPFDAAGAAAFQAAMFSYLARPNVIGAAANQIINMVVSQTQLNVRRRTSFNYVALTFLISSDSALNARIRASTFSSFVYDDQTTSPYSQTNFLTLYQYQTTLLSLSISALEGIISNSNTGISLLAGNTSSVGGAHDYLATGTYNFHYLNAAPIGSNLSSMTVEDCFRVQQEYTPANLTHTFASLLATLLPLPFGSVQIEGGPVTCQSLYPTQTRNDSPAVFVVADMQLTTLYTLFPVNASQVSFANQAVLNQSLQLPDPYAPLSTATVMNFAEIVLQHIVLLGVQAYLRLLCIAFACR